MEWLPEVDRVTGAEYLAVNMRGERLLRDPFLNKGTAFRGSEEPASTVWCRQPSAP